MTRVFFGFRAVPPKDKQNHVNAVFSSVARHYDVMNDLMSFGMHRIWKHQLASALYPYPTMQILDVASGNGDLARHIQARHPHSSITLCDINPTMMRQAQPSLTNCRWVAGNAEALPFADASFDAITIAFGLRNLTDYRQGLAEMHRCLRWGGQFLALELSAVKNIGMRALHEAYTLTIIPRLGRWVAGDYDAYRYLGESIQRFDTPVRVIAAMTAVGFSNSRRTALSLGAVQLYRGIKQ